MKKFLLLSFIIVLTACGSEEGTQTVTATGSHRLEIPNYMSPAKDLNVDATLQYQNIYKEVYLITIADKKTVAYQAIDDNDLNDTYAKDFEGYSRLILDGFLVAIEAPGNADIKKTTINGLPAKTLEVAGRVNDIDIFYYYTLVEGKDTFYQILTWTMLKMEDLYLDTMKAISGSFKEL